MSFRSVKKNQVVFTRKLGDYFRSVAYYNSRPPAHAEFLIILFRFPREIFVYLYSRKPCVFGNEKKRNARKPYVYAYFEYSRRLFFFGDFKNKL